MPRRVVGGLVALFVAAALAACTPEGSRAGSAPEKADGPSGVTGPVTITGADYTEMRIMRSLYGLLLRKAGLEVEYRPSPSRDDYLPALEAGTVDLAPEYAATLTEFLNREVNGATAKILVSSDLTKTVTALKPLAADRGLAVLTPARAANQNGFAVTAAFARAKKVGTLSDLAATGAPVVLAGTKECAARPFCGLGLQRVYGLKVSSVLPLGFGTVAAKQAVIDGQAGLVLVATTDGTVGPLGLKLLTDDKQLQLADNLIPVLTQRLARDPRIAAALNPLAAVLTTGDLARMNEQVDGERKTPEGVAQDYLTAKKLV